MLDTVGQYRTRCADFAGMKNLDVWYAHLDIETVLQELGSQLKPRQVKRTEKRWRRRAPGTACRRSRS